RPAWLSSRMSVYGEALCITTDELAFSETEAREVLTVDSGPTDERILGHARGWPAVIGLAAIRSDAARAITEAHLPADLYTQFAEDLYQTAPPELRRSLYMLALG